MIAEIKTLIIAMSPILELRGSIPVALEVYGLPVYSAFVFSLIGNLIPVVLLLAFLEPVTLFLSKKFGLFNKLFSWIFAKTRQRHEIKFDKWEKFALIILVGLPLPFTGGWTGSLCAFLFNIRFKQAFPLILLGIVIAGVIVSLLSLGVFQII